MQTSVNLQEPFSYSIVSIIILGVIILIIYYFIKKNTKEMVIDEFPEPIVVKSKNIALIQRKYLRKIAHLEKKIINKKISVRRAYQNLSLIIRYFVYEVTNIKVQNYTLKDIKRLKKIPILYELIEEYYAPEFAEHNLGNIKQSLEKTRKVIKRWN